MIKKALYLPIHPAMKPFLKEGMRVIHNGGSGRQGMTGIISEMTKTTGSVKVLFDSHNTSCSFSLRFFLDYFYIEVESIRKLSGFKQASYIRKYQDFITSPVVLENKQLNTHEEMKAIVDAKAKGFTSVYEDKRPRTKDTIRGADYSTVIIDDIKDPLDEVGTFMVIDNDGKWHGTHKTQRLAEIAASSLVKEKNKRLRIVKHCADVDPRVIVEADITRK